MRIDRQLMSLLDDQKMDFFQLSCDRSVIICDGIVD